VASAGRSECGHPQCDLLLEALPWVSASVCAVKAASTNPLTARAIERVRADMAASGREPIVARRTDGS